MLAGEFLPCCSKQMDLNILEHLVRGDEELDTLLDKVCIPGGGVIPHIHKALVVRKDVQSPSALTSTSVPQPSMVTGQEDLSWDSYINVVKA